MNDEETVGRARLFEFIREMGIRLDANTRALQDVQSALGNLRQNQDRAKKKYKGLRKKPAGLGASMRNASPTWRRRSAWHCSKLTCSKTKRQPAD